MGNLLPGKKVALFDAVQSTVDNGGDINVFDRNGYTFLMKAAAKDYSNSMILLLENGADVDAVDARSKRQTALHIACGSGHLKAVRLLLDKGANIEHIDALGYSCLMSAAHRGQTTMTAFLIEKGADVNVINWNGGTALTLAASVGSLSVIKVLLDKGALISNASDYGLVELLRLKGPIGVLMRSAWRTQMASNIANARNRASSTNIAIELGTGLEPLIPTSNPVKLFSSPDEYLWDNSTVPTELLCPIGLELMSDPVLCSDGFSYERYNIEQWFKVSDVSPMTSLHLPTKDLLSDVELKRIIEDAIAMKSIEKKNLLDETDISSISI